MCGIIGYAGCKGCIPYLIEGLEKLEYRGYDSSGVAVLSNNKISVIKAEGKIEKLKEKLKKEGSINGNTGIGHTRWATHGKPSDENSHPHLSQSGLFCVVHNGIIENYGILKKRLIKQGVLFSSETDTEVIAHLLEKEYTGDPLETLKIITGMLSGSYALAVLCSEYPDEIFCTRRQSPLIVGIGDNESFVSSDVTAVLKYTEKVYKLYDGEFARVKNDSVKFFSDKLSPVLKKAEKNITAIKQSGKDGYEHFMLKEINEQPDILKKTFCSYIKKGKNNICPDLTKEYLESVKNIYIVACGSAYHVGVYGKYVMEKLCRIPTQADIASEFRYRDPVLGKETLVIAVTQSGETADTLAAIRLAKNKGAKTLSIVNVPTSTAADESDITLLTYAGVETAVATTKAYSAQLMIMYLLATDIGVKTEKISRNEESSLLSFLETLPDCISNILRNNEKLKFISKQLADAEHLYFIGRNTDYATALEASLKMKEISYIHSEAYGAGELKHGTISLIEKNTVVIALCCCEEVFPKTLSNIKEVVARGAKVICVVCEKHKTDINDAEEIIVIPDTESLFSGSSEVIPMQLLAYYTAKNRGCEIDKPRNLAKSVTVE